MRKFILLCFHLSAFFVAGAQAPSLPNIIMPSPNAASLGKYGDIPVGYHTGSINVSVPIYEVKEGSISLPISLGYHSSGVRVSEISSWVGLGWALNCGGVITRTVQHAPDEGPLDFRIPSSALAGNIVTSGYYKDGYILPEKLRFSTWDADAQEWRNLSEGTAYNLYHNAAIGNVDCEPDIFFYNFGNYSGKFFFKVEKVGNELVRTPVFTPKADVKVQVTFESTSVPTHVANNFTTRETFTSFVITTPDGFKYYFGGSTATEYSGTESYNMTSFGDSYLPKFAPTSWYLTAITAPGGDEITLEYEPDKYGFFDLAGEECWDVQSLYDLSNQMIMRTAINGRRLSRITTSKEEIIFRAETVRQDLSDYENTGGTEQINNVTTKKLDRIEVKKLAGETVKMFDFHQSYFDCSDSKLPKFLELDTQTRQYFYSDKKRLRLDSLVEKSGDLTIVNPGYVFKYNDTGTLPRRMSYQQDHWGYFNGASQNKTLIAYLTEPRNANRLSSESHNKIGVLTSIEYPTGAKSEFDFESHKSLGLVRNAGDTLGRIYGASTFVFPDDPDEDIVPFEVKALAPLPGLICGVDVECDETAVTFSIYAGDPRPVTTNYDLNYSIYSGDIIAGIYKADGTIVRAFFVGDLQNTNSTDCQTPLCLFYNNPDDYLHIGRDVTVSIPPGSYYLRALRIAGPKRNDPSKTVMYTASISVFLPAIKDANFQPAANNVLSTIGGLRIKKITNTDQNSEISERVFLYPEKGGILFGKPNYSYGIHLNDIGNPNRDHIDSLAGLGVFSTRLWSSTSILPMQSTQGSHLGYDSVVEKQAGNGFTRYTYDVGHYEFPIDDPYFAGNSYSYESKYRYFNYPAYPAPFLLERGNLLTEDNFTEAGIKVRSKKMNYETGNYELVARATKVSFIIGRQTWQLGDPSPSQMGDLPSHTNYPIFSGTSRLVKETETTFGPNSDSLNVVTEYKYESDKHLQLTETKKILSDSVEEVTRMIYPTDYGVLSDTTGGIGLLQFYSVINIPIETYTIRRGPGLGSSLITEASITTFKTDRTLRHKVWILKTSPLITEANFNVSNRNSGAFLPDSRYEPRISFYGYDSFRNIKDLGKSKDFITSYVWGYNHTLPIAEVKNAPSNKILHTSFEELTINFSVEAITGKKSSTASYPVVLPSEGTYILTYWIKSGSGPWQFIQSIISGNTSIGGSGSLIDEVRLYPRGAMMTTYTYDTAFGLTSSTDPNNVTTFFEYDKLGRLSVVRDHDRNIIRSTEYHYRRTK